MEVVGAGYSKSVTETWSNISIMWDCSVHKLLLEHIYLPFWGYFTSICPRLLNNYETGFLGPVSRTEVQFTTIAKSATHFYAI